MRDSTSQIVRRNNRWRESYNPLRNLVLSRVVSLLEAGERGEFADLQWLYRFVERRFPVLRSLIIRRRSALVKLDWEVEPICEPPPGVTDEQVKAQVDFLKSRYEAIGNLREAIRFLALAEFRGFSILQKHFGDGTDQGLARARPSDGARPSGPSRSGEERIVTELHWLPQWNFVRDGMFGDWFWNPEARSGGYQGLEGNRIDLATNEFIVREVEMPIDEIGVIAFVRSNLSQKDWDAFVEMFGLPGCVVVMPPNIPPGKEDEYESSAQKVAEGASGALPNGADAKFPTSAVRGVSPFREHLEWQEKDVVLAGTGGKLTMLTGPTGLGGQQAEVHEDVFDEIATAEAAEISEIFQKQFDEAELAAAFPGQPVLAYWQLKPVDKTADETLKFRREVFRGFMTDGTVSDVLANQTGLKQLTEDVGLPVNEEYEDPYLPVTSESGLQVQGVTPGGDRIAKPPKPAKTPAAEGVVATGDAAAAVAAPAVEDVQATALNGAQVTALASLVEKVAMNQLPSAAAIALAEAAFPLVSRDLIARIFAPLEGFTPEAAVNLKGPDLTGGNGGNGGGQPQGEGNRQGGPASAEATVGRQGEVKNRDDGLRVSASPREAFAAALARDLAPVRERLQRILAIEDPGILQVKLEGFLQEVEGLKRDLAADPEAARALEELNAQAMAKGLTGVKDRI